MKKNNYKYLGLFTGLILCFGCKNQALVGTKSKAESNAKPNIIYILADDMGYGDLSCYGQTKFSTPNIDKLAKEGMLFTQHYAGTTVCAPSRSSFLTGQDTGHTPVRGNKAAGPEGEWPMPAKTFTLAEVLKEKGYQTGAFGKWGLGFPSSEGDPLNQGFDTFYGYNGQILAHNYYPYYLWNNREKVMLKGNEGTQKNEYAPILIHEQALAFIEKNKDKPFFLYYPSIIPHAELVAPEVYMKKHIGHYGPEKEYKGNDGQRKGYRLGKYGSQKYPHAAFAAMINLLDDQVGEIMDKVKALGLEDNTIFIFTSDNGPHLEGGADPDYFDSNGIYKGYKRDLYEGGIRVPMIAKWKGKIPSGITTNHVSAFWDVMPTVTDILKIEKPSNIQGISFLPTLLGHQESQKQHDYLYWEFHEKKGRQAIRRGDWKLIRYNVNNGGKNQLYNLKDDPSETNDLANKLPNEVAQLAKILEGARVESEVFEFGKKK